MKTKKQNNNLGRWISFFIRVIIFVVIIAYFIRFRGLDSIHSGGSNGVTLKTSCGYDALTDKPAHVLWVILHELKPNRCSGGNSECLIIDEKHYSIPVKSHFVWFKFLGESSDPNLFYLTKDLQFINLGYSINLDQLNDIHVLMRYNNKLKINPIKIVEMVIGKKINIPNQSNNEINTKKEDKKKGRSA
jgi:hypothetical protein